MKKLSKGQITRNTILEKSRYIFNEKGLDITLDIIAREMGLSKGRITNHFSTKESLFQGIMGYYEWQLSEYFRLMYAQLGDISFEWMARLISGAMDIQYENRCAIGYLAMITPEKKEVHDHITATYKRNVQSIRARVGLLVEQDLLVKEVLQAKTFQVFLFQYVTLLTNWVISEQHYSSEAGYEAMKPIYLSGIMQCYRPYLTEKGAEQFRQINFNKIAKSV